VVLYELLTSITPVDKKSLGKAAVPEILRVVREAEAQRPSAKALDLLIELYTAIDKPDEANKWQTERAKYPEARIAAASEDKRWPRRRIPAPLVH
jgi:hypothetical protein